jgi:hypothetical protein
MQQRIGLRTPARVRMLQRITLVLAILLAGIALPAEVWAQEDEGSAPPPTVVEPASAEATQGTTVKITASKDTFIASGFPNSNFGGLQNLDVGWYAAYNAVRPLIKFKLDGIPSNARIYGAQVVMFLETSLPSNDGNMQLNYARATQDWNEGGATWNNAAGIGGSQSGLGSVGTGQGWASFDLTSQVQQWVNGQSNHGMIIIGDETPSRQRARIFLSRETGNAPYLLVNYECDTLAPQTFMNALPQYSPGSFTASWGGQDRAPSGCKPTGIRKHVVQYRINGGAWVDWKSTTSSSHTFDNFAPNGARVDFRTWADDNAGNTEATPGSPQASTIIVSQTPPVTFTPLPQYTYGSSFTVSWSAGSSPVGIVGYDVQYQVNDGPWIDLVSASPQTSYQFVNAQNESTYGFRARARDALGNVGQYPAGAEVSTTVVLFPIARITPFFPNIINSTSPVTKTFTVNWSGSTPPGTQITSYQIYVRVFNLQGVQQQPWTLWKTFDGTVTSTTYDVKLGNGIYDFEATATNNLGETTPFSQQPESTMIVDLDDTIDVRIIMPLLFGN